MRALLLALALSGAADAGSLAGVTLPDSATVGGQSLVLNGLGLREKLFIDIYVGGLYLPAKTSDAAKAIADDVPKRIVMAFLYIMRDSMESAGSPEAAEHAGTLASWMEAVKPGDQIVLDYVPGEGCSVLVKGKKKGTLPGVGLMQALWGIYLGPNPPTAALKQGMLGR